MKRFRAEPDGIGIYMLNTPYYVKHGAIAHSFVYFSLTKNRRAVHHMQLSWAGWMAWYRALTMLTASYQHRILIWIN